MAKLKVFAWSNGLKTYAVATTSRPKALEAWGINQDMFKEGLAREVDDPALVEAATAQPGQVIEQAVGGGAAKALAAVKPASKPTGPTAAQKKIAALKDQLAALEAEHARAVEALDDRRRALDWEAEALQADHDQAREALTAKLRAAQAKR